MTREIIIRETDEAMNLVEFLARRFTYQSPEQWASHISAGRVTLNGSIPETAPPSNGAREGIPIQVGDRVTFTPPDYEEPPVNKNWSVLLEDDDFLFVNKPPLLPCHPAGIYFNNTLLELLRADRSSRDTQTPCGMPPAQATCLHLVNRLDRETSGIVIVAKHTEAAAFGSRALAEPTAEKEYLALVEGDFSASSTATGVDAKGWLVRDSESPIRKKLKFVRDDAAENGEGTQNRQFVHTTFFAQEYGAPRGISLVRARLHTGKTHQIRATLEALGFPIVGDKLYGRDPELFLRFAAGTLSADDENTLRMPHQALHCARVALSARSGDTYRIEAPLPESWIRRF